MKKWLCERYLPTYLRGELLAENRRLRQEIDSRKREIEQLEAYIDGMQDAMLRQSKIIIKGRESDR